MAFIRITVRSDQMAGRPCIRNMRIPVSVVLAMLADGMTESEILDACPDLEAGNRHGGQDDPAANGSLC